MYTTMNKPVMLCGCETSKMTQQKKSSFKTWERKILRKICGTTEGQNDWGIRTNDDLRVTCRKPNILTTMQVRKLEWAGHLVRMSDNRTVKKVFLGKPDGRSKAGRPK
jgi:hypothetical protein